MAYKVGMGESVVQYKAGLSSYYHLYQLQDFPLPSHFAVNQEDKEVTFQHRSKCILSKDMQAWIL